MRPTHRAAARASALRWCRSTQCRSSNSSGELALDEGRLRRAVEERYGAAPPVGRADDVARTLRRLYEDEGYLSSAIRAVPRELHDPDRTVLTFEVHPGPRALINNVQLQGTLLTPAPVLMKRLDAIRGAPYRASRIQQRLDEYRTDLRQRGYYRASDVHPPAAGRRQHRRSVHRHRVGAARLRAVRGRSAAAGSAERAGADSPRVID